MRVREGGKERCIEEAQVRKRRVSEESGSPSVDGEWTR
jgi:hypothetical protein